MSQRQFASGDTSTWNDRYGNGSDGAASINTSTDATANTTISVTSGSTSATAGSGTGFAAGNLILIHQSRNGGAGAGAWELNKISSVGGGTNWTLTYATVQAYDTTAQVYLLKQYSSVSINSGQTLTSSSWDGTKGGIIAFLCSGTVNGSGTIAMSGVGYRGGAAPTGTNGGFRGEGTSGDNATAQTSANGSGGGGGSGGAGVAPGGAGGGHSATGSNGANGEGTGGTAGGSAGVAALTTMVFGGAAGAGGSSADNSGTRSAGGSGGGLLLIIAKTIDLSSITAVGINGLNGGSASNRNGFGGGGAGGSALLKGQTVNIGTSKITASAGAAGSGGGSTGAGGGAGTTGRVHADYSATISGSSSPTLDSTLDLTLSDGVSKDNSVKAQIIRPNNLDANSPKANIKVTTTQPNSAKANLIKFRGVQDSSARGNILPVVIKKRYGYKLYYSATDIRDSWGNEILSEPTFRFTINGGAGQVIVRLARKIDAFGEDDDIVLNRQVDIYVYDRETPNGLLLYRGFISNYAPVLDGGEEYVEVTILGYAVEIGARILKDNAGNTTIDYLSEDPSIIMKDVIDKYRNENGNLNYNATSIETTGTSVSYRFANYTVKEALDKIIELTPYNWFWRIDPDSTIYLKQRSASADHKLYIGKHISYMRPEKSLEALRNVVYFVGGTPEGQAQLYRKYTRSASISTWGRWEEVVTDSRVTVTTSADTRAGRFLDEHQEPDVRTVIRILDSNGLNPNVGYDIESIKPGNTISIENLKTSQKALTLWDQFSWDQDNWDFALSSITSDILYVTTINYAPDMLEIEASRALPIIAKRIEDIQRNVDALTTDGLPIAPTNA